VILHSHRHIFGQGYHMNFGQGYRVIYVVTLFFNLVPSRLRLHLRLPSFFSSTLPPPALPSPAAPVVPLPPHPHCSGMPAPPPHSTTGSHTTVSPPLSRAATPRIQVLDNLWQPLLPPSLLVRLYNNTLTPDVIIIGSR
jgi:hypothetical protein